MLAEDGIRISPHQKKTLLALTTTVFLNLQSTKPDTLAKNFVWRGWIWPTPYHQYHIITFLERLLFYYLLN
jgi:hypothetical protein